MITDAELEGTVQPKGIEDEAIRSEIENRKLWPYAEARKVLSRHNYDSDFTYIFESGFGPSGFPHIGTFGEVVRTEFIINALKEFGFKTKLIVFSDDLDGLRKVPEDMPTWLKDHLGKPVSSIPDPFGECSSFSEHMNNKLKQMLDWIEIDYEFKSSRETYTSGEFDEGLKILLSNYKTLEDIIVSTLSEKTLQTWYPFFPICERCGRILTTIVQQVNLQASTIKYSCTKGYGDISGCGYEGEQSFLGGHGKVTWRVDWPLRWYALRVDYELYGKDLIESFIVGEKIMNRIFKIKEPANMYYEMFLDESGAKISKSKGKGLTVDDWLKYGNLESIRLLMFRQPQKAKELSFKIIPRYVDNVIASSRDFHNRKGVKEHEFEFITRFKAKDCLYPNISYMLICNLMTTLKTTNGQMIKGYLSKQQDLSRSDLDSGLVDDLVRKAGRYYSDFITTEAHDVALSVEDIFHIWQVIDLLQKDLTAEEIHNSIYEIAKKNNMEPPKLFRLLYLSLLGQEKGPRLGSFIKMIGQEKTIDILQSRVMSILSAASSERDAEKERQLNKEERTQETLTQAVDKELGFKTATRKLYYENVYQKDFQAKITKISGDRIFLDQTCFYPKSGGQVGDIGYINDLRVIETFYEDKDIAHRVENMENLEVEQVLRCSIDWDRRYSIMKLHSASHIMEYFLFKLCGKVERLGSNVDEHSDHSTYRTILNAEQIAEVEKHVNDFIHHNYDISVSYLDEEKDIRIWKAGDITEICGGTHPNNTREIGKVSIRRKSGGKGITKITTRLAEIS